MSMKTFYKIITFIFNLPDQIQGTANVLFTCLNKKYIRAKAVGNINKEKLKFEIKKIKNYISRFAALH